jgi:effector-binding domain-containing protein/DNA-binding transcriptional MerR regulator
MKPEMVGENGYRYYGINQMIIFDTISAFKGVGTPLSQISEFLDNKDTASFLAMLKTEQREIEAKIKNLEKTQRILTETIDTTEKALEAEYGTIVIGECGKEYLIVFDALKPEDSEVQFMVNVRQHIMKYRQNDYGYEFPMGGITLLEDVIKGNFKETYYYSKTSYNTNDDRMIIKPAGMYAMMYYRGSYDAAIEVYPDIKSRIEDMGYRVCGDFYQEDQLYFLSEQDINNYVVKILVPVEKDNR